MHRSLRWTSLGCLCSAYLMWACQAEPDRVRFIATELVGKIDFYDEPDERDFDPLLLWKHGTHGVRFLEDLEHHRLASVHKKTVMVSFPKDSELSTSLKDDPLTRLYDGGSSESPGFALVEMPSPDFRDSLAIAAHQALGHVCGAIESVHLTEVYALTSEPDQPIIPPVIAEAVKVPEVERLLAKPDPSAIATTIQNLESLGTRFHSSVTGEATPGRVKSLMTAAVGDRLPRLTFELPETDNSSQTSVIAALPGEKDDTTTVIVGAHLDSINRGGAALNAPGADDDASGVATMVEVLRAIADSGVKFERRIEFHAYGAEEVGLEGSITIARRYQEAKRRVAGMLQIDMNAWSETPDTTIHFVTTSTSPYLVRASKDLMHTYLGGDFTSGPLTAGTSDHKSWFVRGFPAVFPFENPQRYNPALHSENDTSQGINNLPLAVRFSKLVLAYLAHEAGLITNTIDKATSDSRATFSKDLKLAVIPNSSSTAYTIGVAAGDTGIKSVDLCRVGSRGSLACTHERLTAKNLESRNGRALYYLSTALPLADGDRFSVFGYDQTEKLIAQRTIKLTKK
jgi:hypothetical protein